MSLLLIGTWQFCIFTGHHVSIKNADCRHIGSFTISHASRLPLAMWRAFTQLRAHLMAKLCKLCCHIVEKTPRPPLNMPQNWGNFRLLRCRKSILICVALSIFRALFMVIYNDTYQTWQNRASFTFKDDTVEAQEDIRAVAKGIVKLEEI